MVQKKLQSESQYNEYDLDKDGVVSDKELEVVTKMHETETRRFFRYPRIHWSPHPRLHPGNGWDN